MRLYDTRLGRVVDFDAGPTVSMYVCGITPYDATHLGHAATYVTYDILQRRLRDRGHETRCVRNITDVDDDMLAAARSRGIHYLDLAFAETARFDEDMAALNTLAPWSEPRATGAIADIRGAIDAILAGGLGYVVDGTVYFDTRLSESFGSLSGIGRDRMLEVGRGWREDPDDPAKRDPLDFVLWRPSADDEPVWQSRWGPGRPGWHIECSALARRELGESVDLHGGGVDLLHPHHECVRVQSEAIVGAPVVRHWMHQEMVHLDGHKMSKSRGNLRFVHDLTAEVDPMAVRLVLCAHHYRRPWQWSDDLVAAAAERLAGWRAAGHGDGAIDEVRAHLDDDLDVPGAVAAIDRAVSDGRGVTTSAALLGVDLGPRNR